MRVMRFLLTYLVLCLVMMPGCSDLGTGSDQGWVRYELPGGYISLPAELEPRRSVAAMPENPEFVGTVNNQFLQVQFCIYTPLYESAFRSYKETTITLNGRRVVFFEGLGAFHMYDSHFSTMIGAKAYFTSVGDPVVVVVAIQAPENEDLAHAILLTLHP